MDELRKINCDLGTLPNSDGSAMYACGETCVAVSVNGPCLAGQRKLSVDEAIVDIMYRPRCGNTGIQDKVVESILSGICKVAILTSQYPRTVISVVLQAMDDAGGLLACSINGLCLALMHAGLPLRFVFAAVCCIIDQHGNIIIDPDHKQIKSGAMATFTITMDQQGLLVSTEASGSYTTQQLNDVIIQCQAATSVIFQFYKDVFRRFSDKIAL